MGVDPEALRKTMRIWASGVTIVTSAMGERKTGVTASSFTSVALDPPTVLVCLQNHTETYRMIQETGVMGISILKADQAKLSGQFAGFVELPEGADRFYGVETTTDVTGAPLLTQAAAWIDCRLKESHLVGATGILIGEVVSTNPVEGAMPLIYHNRWYYDLSSQT